MKPRSLRLRLFAGAALWIVLSLTASSLALVYMFTANVERDVVAELTASRNLLIAGLSSSPQQDLLEQRLVDPRYSTPFGGLYWQVRAKGTEELLRSRSLWDVVMTPRSQDPTELTNLDGPDGQRLAAISGEVTLDKNVALRTFEVTVGVDRTSVDESIGRFRLEMSAALVVVGLALLLAAWLQVNLGLSPLSALARGIAAIRVGNASKLGGDYPTEVQPLVGQVNELLAAQEESIASARQRAGDLAHGLKTPISVMVATAGRLRQRGDDSAAETLEALSAEMSERINYQLRLASIRPRTPLQTLRASLNSSLIKPITVLRKTGKGERIHWQMRLDRDVAVDIDEHDLLELTGIVLENALKWAESCVEIGTRLVGDRVEITISDDGPGLTEAQIAQIGVRGRRIDESKPGSGFGLAIANEILAQNRGAIRLRRSASKGLLVELVVPIAP